MIIVLFKAKIRKIGSSFGVLIPMEIIENQKIKEDEIIEISILKKNPKLIEEMFGSIKAKTTPFKRDRKDREF